MKQTYLKHRELYLRVGALKLWQLYEEPLYHLKQQEHALQKRFLKCCEHPRIPFSEMSIDEQFFTPPFLSPVSWQLIPETCFWNLWTRTQFTHVPTMMACCGYKFGTSGPSASNTYHVRGLISNHDPGESNPKSNKPLLGEAYILCDCPGAGNLKKNTD